MATRQASRQIHGDFKHFAKTLKVFDQLSRITFKIHRSCEKYTYSFFWLSFKIFNAAMATLNGVAKETTLAQVHVLLKNLEKLVKQFQLKLCEDILYYCVHKKGLS